MSLTGRPIVYPPELIAAIKYVLPRLASQKAGYVAMGDPEALAKANGINEHIKALHAALEQAKYELIEPKQASLFGG